MATQLSRKRRTDDVYRLSWEEDDGVTLTQEHIDAGEVTIQLSWVPLPKTFQAWWHPVEVE